MQTGCTFHSRLHPNFVLVLNLPVNVQLVTSAANFGVNESWLRTGEGEMFAAPTAASDKIMNFAAEIARNDDKEFRKRLVVMLADLEPKDWELLERIAEKLTT